MDKFASISLFVAAIEEGSLVAAGRRFDLSPSMAGKYLSNLEGELKVRLIQRTTRKLTPTEAGRIYYARCKRILDEFDEANQEASESSSNLRGLLRISAPVTFASLHMGSVIARFLADYPQVNAEIILDDRYVDLVAQSIDVAIRIGKLPDSDLVAKRLAPCQMVVCAAPAFLKREGVPRTPQDLHNQPRLAFSLDVSANSWTLTDSHNQIHIVDGPLRMHANNMSVLLSAALAGIGIAYGPTFVFGEKIASGDLVRLLPDYQTQELTVNAIFPTGRYLPTKVRRLIDYLEAEFAGVPPWDRSATKRSV